MTTVTVLRTGPQALVQDRGRPGYAHLGVPPSGALDHPALALANRLVGNPADAAGIEALLGGVTLRADGPCVIAVTGAIARLRLTRSDSADADAGAAVGGGSAGTGSAAGSSAAAASGSGSSAAAGSGLGSGSSAAAGSGSGLGSGSSVAAGSGSGSVDFATAVRMSAGDVLRIGTPSSGLRCYVAISGGIAVPAELGSRSTDVLSGIGPAPLSAGDELPLGDATARAPADTTSDRDTPAHHADDTTPDRDTRAHHADAAAPDRDTRAYRGDAADADRDTPAHRDGSPLELPVLLGPRDGWFDDAAEQLTAAEWTVSPTGNRIGVWLTGATLRRTADVEGVELPTEPVVAGAVQVPPSGQPVIFLNDHPTTGGYPVIAVVRPEALPLLAQTRPGTPVRLRP